MAHDLRTARALEESIQHWARNCEARQPSDASTNGVDCALCREFNPRELPIEDACAGCPVREFTGERMCNSTPFADASRALRRWTQYAEIPGDPKAAKALPEAFRAAAKKELLFLISLKEPGK